MTRLLQALLLSVLALVFATCGSANLVRLDITADGPVDMYDVYAWAAQSRGPARLVHRQGFAVVQTRKGEPVDLTKTSLRAGFSVRQDVDYTIVVLGARSVTSGGNPIAQDGVHLAPGAIGYFGAVKLRVTQQNLMPLRLLKVASQHTPDACIANPDPNDDDCDGDSWPDAVSWLQHSPEAQRLYADRPELLDCSDKMMMGNLSPALFHPFADEICDDGLDQACTGTPDSLCVDSDGDGDPDPSDCAPQDATRHHPTSRDPYPETGNCCGYSIGKTGTERNQSFLGRGCNKTCGDGIDQDCDGSDDACINDQDCDEVVSSSTPAPGCNAPPGNGPDCNDCDAAISPFVPEICDRKDNTCNGVIDEGCVPCDLDGDGFQRSDSSQGCPDGTNQGKPLDCNDFDSGVFPGSTTAVRIPTLPGGANSCNGKEGGSVACAWRGACRNRGVNGNLQDLDCDGDAGDGCPIAACDADGDGFVPANLKSQAPCTAYQGAPDDCNDNDPEIFPGAPDRCGDGILQNCSGDTACITDRDGDGFNEEADCAPDDATVHPWATELCNGRDDDCDGVRDEGNPDATGAPLAQNGAITACTDSDLGECGKRPGLCVCSSTAIDTLSFNQARRVACPGETAEIDTGAQKSDPAPRCYLAGQPSAEVCDVLDNDCDPLTLDVDGFAVNCPGSALGPTCCLAASGMTAACQNTAASLANCGRCNLACSTNNVTNPQCNNGQCEGTCASGFGDCNSDLRRDGCEATLTTPANCGACNNNCAGSSAGMACVNVGGRRCGCNTASDCNSQIANVCAGSTCQCGSTGRACNPDYELCEGSGSSASCLVF